jgi:endo-1,4-beta-xylanase
MRLPILFTLASLTLQAADPQVFYLWNHGAPGSEGQTAEETMRTTTQGEHVVATIHKPSIAAYLPEKSKATGAAVVIAPGGGHSELWMDHEGTNLAKLLSEHGVAAFVLKYRLARQKGSTYTIEGTSLQDTQRAVKLIKSHAAEFMVDADRIGVMGFSAGGELAALAGTHIDEGKADSGDAIDRFSSKVGFFALIYPAIPKDMPLSKDLPPAFLACGENDRVNISQGLPELYIAMKKAGAQAELHVYAGVGHGFGVRPTTKGPVGQWPQRFLEWMDSRSLLAAKK